MKLFTTIPGATTVDLNHVEILQRGLTEGVIPDGEGLGHEGVLRPGVDVFDNGVLLLRVKRIGAHDDAMDVKFAGTIFRNEATRGFPARRPQFGVISLAELRYLASIFGVTEDKARWEVDARIGIHEVLAAWAELDVVRAVALRELH